MQHTTCVVFLSVYVRIWLYPLPVTIIRSILAVFQSESIHAVMSDILFVCLVVFHAVLSLTKTCCLDFVEDIGSHTSAGVLDSALRPSGWFGIKG